MNKYDWIKPGVHAWVAGLVCPVEVEIKKVAGDELFCMCGNLYTWISRADLCQTEAECLAAMKKEL